MSESTARLDLGGGHPVEIHTVALGRPWAWLAAGWKDLIHAPATSLAYGAIWVAISLALVGGLWVADYGYWFMTLAAGFMLIGPIVAVGTYDISARLAEGRTPGLKAAFLAWRINATQIALMGALLMLFLLAWIRFATLFFFLFFGNDLPSSSDGLSVSTLLFSPNGLAMLAAGSAIGAVLAFVSMALSVVSIPRLLDQPRTSVLEAAIISLAVVQKNLKPMILWGIILGVVTFMGIAAGLVGLAVTLPLLGHASWHAYRELVTEAA
jgi:uncharacterized membrane protein